MTSEQRPDLGGPGPGVPDLGGLDFSSLIAQASQVQQQLVAAQAELAAARVTGTSGGGLVTATVSGTGELVDLVIDPVAVDPDDEDLATTLADLVLAAVRDAASSAAQRASAQLGSLPGLPSGLPGVPGLPGA